MRSASILGDPSMGIGLPQFLGPRATFPACTSPARWLCPPQWASPSDAKSVPSSTRSAWFSPSLALGWCLSLSPRLSFPLHLLPPTSTSQSVVPSLATPQLAPWPADTGSESSSRYWGDSGQTVFRVTCFLPTPPNFLTVTTLPPLSTSSVHFDTLIRRLMSIRMSKYLKKMSTSVFQDHFSVE